MAGDDDYVMMKQQANAPGIRNRGGCREGGRSAGCLWQCFEGWRFRYAHQGPEVKGAGQTSSRAPSSSRSGSPTIRKKSTAATTPSRPGAAHGVCAQR